jgi:hypothetical protein
MNGLLDGELRIDGERPGPELIRLHWKGRSASLRPDGVLEPYLQQVLEDARQTMSALEMRFELMEYLNSATVAVLVHFLHRARLSGIAVRFTYRPSVRWQRLSFEALRVFEHLDAMVQVVPVTTA